MNDDIRLAYLLAGMSLISDMGRGLAPENAMRSCLVGTALARAIDLDDAGVAEVFHTSLLRHIGCTGYAHETYLVWIDDIAANSAARTTNFADPRGLFNAYLHVHPEHERAPASSHRCKFPRGSRPPQSSGTAFSAPFTFFSSRAAKS